MAQVKGGKTSWTGYRVRIFDPATGLPYTGATSATAGASAGYTRTGSTRTAITLSDLAAVNSAYSAGGIKHIGGGEYRLDPPDAAIAAGVDEVTIDLSFTAYTAVCAPVYILGYDPRTDAVATVAGMLDSNVVDWKGATAVAMTGDAYARIGANGAGLTAVGDTRLANLDAAVSSRSTLTVAQVWDRLTSALTTTGSIGKLIVDYLDAAVSSRLATSGYTVPPNVGAIADQVWDEALSGHTTSGTAGAALTASGSAADPLTNAVPGTYAAGTAGNAIARLTSGVTVTFTGPVLTSGDVVVVQGDDYSATDGRSLDWTYTDATADYTSSTAQIVLDKSGTTKTFTMNAPSKSGSTVTLRWVPSATDTADTNLSAGVWTFQIHVTLSSGRKLTPVRGSAAVIDRIA